QRPDSLVSALARISDPSAAVVDLCDKRAIAPKLRAAYPNPTAKPPACCPPAGIENVAIAIAGTQRRRIMCSLTGSLTCGLTQKEVRASSPLARSFSIRRLT